MDDRRALEDAHHELLRALRAVYQNPNAFLLPFAQTPEQALLALAKQPDFFGPYVGDLTETDKARLMRDVHQAAIRCLQLAADLDLLRHGKSP